MSVEYQVQMVYRQEDVAALVKVLEFRRRPEKNLRLARKIGYPGGHCPSAPVGQQGNGPTVLGPVPQQGDDLDLYFLQGPF